MLYCDSTLNTLNQNWRCQGEGARQSRAVHGTRTGNKQCHFKIPFRLDGEDFFYEDSRTVAKAAHIVQSLNLGTFNPQLDQPVLTQQLTLL